MKIKFSQTLLLISSLFILICGENSIDPETSKKRVECIEKCGGGTYIHEVVNKKEFKCVSDWLGFKIGIHTPCLVECMGAKPDEDQPKCLTEFCKTEGNFKYFCSESKNGPIGKGECDLVEKGDALPHICLPKNTEGLKGGSPDTNSSVPDCLAKHCMQAPNMFCAKPKGVSIKKEECDTLARNGDAKPYDNCAPAK